MADLKLLQRIHLLVVFAMIVTTGVTFFYFIQQQPQLETQADHTPQTVEFTLANPLDSINQDGTSATASAQSAWIGTRTSLTDSYLGLRFSGTALPYQAKVLSATLIVTAADDTSMGVNMDIFGELNDASKPFQNDALPNTRMKTIAVKEFDTHVPWLRGASYLIDVTKPVAEILEKTKSREFITLLIEGRGGTNGKRLIYTTGSASPVLQIRFETH